MEEGTLVPLAQPGAAVEADLLLAVLRDGARRLLTQAIEAEVETFGMHPATAAAGGA